MRVGLIGCGAIGKILVNAIRDKKAGKSVLVAVFDQDFKIVNSLFNEKWKLRPYIAKNIDDFLQQKMDVVIEAASQRAVYDYGEKILDSKKDLMILSAGALLDGDFRKKLVKAAERNGKKIYVPTGAIAGLDAVKAARMAKIGLVKLTTTKNPRGYERAPFVVERKIDLSKIGGPTTVYEGPAREAVKNFPANVNVAASLSLAAGKDATVAIVADPSTEKNIHEVEVEGEFGKLMVKVENVVCPDNPKTSYLAALSAIALLKKLSEPLIVGT
jgi:aspartate dehydrogenase